MKSIFFGFRMSLTLSVMSFGFLQPMMSHGRDGRNTKRSSSLTTVMSAFFPSRRLSSNAAVNPPNDPPSTTILAIASSPYTSYLIFLEHPYHLLASSYDVRKFIVVDDF